MRGAYWLHQIEALPEKRRVPASPCSLSAPIVCTRVLRPLPLPISRMREIYILITSWHLGSLCVERYLKQPHALTASQIGLGAGILFVKVKQAAARK